MSQHLSEPSLENAAHGPFTCGLPLEHGSHDASARTTLAAELFPSPPDIHRREPASSEPIVEELLKAVEIQDDAEV